MSRKTSYPPLSHRCADWTPYEPEFPVERIRADAVRQWWREFIKALGVLLVLSVVAVLGIYAGTLAQAAFGRCP